MALYAQIERTSGSLAGTQVFGQMSIVIYDAATNLPTNGNGCIVTYSQNINGTITTGLSVIVPGTSYPVYTGKISDSNPTSPFTTSWYNISISAGTGTVDPGADDLVLVAVVSTPVSSIGASDGTVKIIATSSFAPLQYSLDNINWQTDPLFTGQPGGLGTAYVKDANGGTAQSSYTVDFLGKALTDDPSVNLGNGNISYWNAAFNPIYFSFQRNDFEVTSVAADSFGKIKININAYLSGLVARSVSNGITSPGDKVYLKTALYDGIYEVIGINGSLVSLDCPFVGTDTLGFVNINRIRPYYQIQLQITYVDPISGNFNTLNLSFTPKANGFLQADISQFVSGLVSAADGSNYSQINYRDPNLSASYTVKWAEVWQGGGGNFLTITRPFYVIYAAKQLGDKGAGNLQEFVPYLQGFQPAKWLTDFQIPVYSPGFPFDLPFIFSEYMVGLAPFYNVTMLDINQQPIANVSPVISGNLLNEDGSFQLNQDASKFIIAEQSSVNTPIVEHLGLNRLLINFSLPDNCYFLKVQLQYTASGSTYNLTKPIIVRVNKDTPDRPVYIRWIGLNGSWNYYKFVYNQTVALEVSNSVMSKKYVFDWENDETIESVISKNAGKKITVFGENIPVCDIDALENMLSSPKVQIMTSAIPVKWQTVIVPTGGYALKETMLEYYSFSCTLALPGKNIQNQ